MDLQYSRNVRNNGRGDRALERSGGGNHVVGFDHALRRFDTEAGPADIPLHILYLHAAADGGGDLFRVGDEIVRNLLFMGKGVGIDIGKLHTRKPVVPGRTIRDHGVPSFRAPAFGNSVPLQNEVRHAAVAQVLAHGQAGLAAANDERFYFFRWHLRVLFQHSKIIIDLKYHRKGLAKLFAERCTLGRCQRNFHDQDVVTPERLLLVLCQSRYFDISYSLPGTP